MDNLIFENELIESQLLLETEEKLKEQWETLGISNDFIFCKVMQDTELLKELIRRILPELRFTDLKVEAQKTIEIGPDIHGVRFDVFGTLEDGSAVDIEMQVLNTGNLPKRMRYYGSMADVQMLEKGNVYNGLMESYVIMICPFDLFGEGRHVYTFKNLCKENPELELGDGTFKLVLNAAGTMNDASAKLQAFLDYVAGKAVDDEFIEKLDEAVKRARINKKWRTEYMIINMRDREHEYIGRMKGIEEHKRMHIAEMLRRGKKPEDIAEFCDYPMELIEEVQKNMMAETVK